MKKTSSTYTIKSSKTYPDRITGTITVGGEKVKIGPETVPVTHGASPRRLIELMKKAVKERIFPEPALP